MVKGLEGKVHEEHLKSLGLVGLEETSLQLQLPYEEKRRGWH